MLDSSSAVTTTQIFEGEEEAAPNEPLKSQKAAPEVQAILDALPPRCLKSNLTETERGTYGKALEAAETVKQVVELLFQIARTRHAYALDRLLVRLDNEHFDRRWLCKKCGYRWGLHDDKTLACPKSEIDPSEL